MKLAPFFLVPLVLLLHSDLALSESGVPSSRLPGTISSESTLSSDCAVTVRVIKGSGNDTGLKGVKAEVGKYLSDMKSQLQPLPYRSYKVLGDELKKVQVGKAGNFMVKDAAGETHQLRVQPLLVENSKVRVMVDWKGPQQESLLSTQLKVANGENVVLGTDTNGDESTIMSITVLCG